MSAPFCPEDLTGNVPASQEQSQLPNLYELLASPSVDGDNRLPAPPVTSSEPVDGDGYQIIDDSNTQLYPNLAERIDCTGQVDLIGAGMPSYARIMGYRPYYSAPSFADVMVGPFGPASPGASEDEWSMRVLDSAREYFNAERQRGSYRLNSETGSIDYLPPNTTIALIARVPRPSNGTAEDDLRLWRESGSYYIDRQTGSINWLPPSTVIIEQPRQRTGTAMDDYHYGLDPRTGQITLMPNNVAY